MNGCVPDDAFAARHVGPLRLELWFDQGKALRLVRGSAPDCWQHLC